MDSVSDSSVGSPPMPSPVDTSTDSAPVGGTNATDGGDTSATSAPASAPASTPAPIKDTFDAGTADPATRSAPTAPTAPAAGTDTGNKVPPNTFQADRNKDTFTPASGQPTSGANKLTGQSQPPPAVDTKKADDPKPTAAADQPAPAADTKKADDKKPDVKADDKKPDVKADDKKPDVKADDKKPDAKAAEKKADAKKADEKKADEKKADTKKADDKKPDDKKPDDTKKPEEKKAEEKKSKPTEVTVSKDEIKAKKEGDLLKKETKKEVEKKGGAELPKARENKGPVAELAKGKTEEAKIGSDVGPGASAKGEFKATLGTGGLDVNGTVKLDAHALHLNKKVETTIPFEYGGEKFQAKLALEGDLKIGGDADLKVNLHVGTDGRLSVNLGADGFAGVKGSLKGTVSVESKPGNDPNAEWKPLVEGTASLSAYAGIAGGASFKVQGDVTSGKLGFEAKAFGSAGVGVGFGLDGTINTKNVAELGGRIGMKFANDVGQAVNLPGATMDYFNAASRGAELDRIAAPMIAKAHAGDAWMQQGYDKMLPSEQLNKAISTLDYHKNFDMVDTAASIGSKDGIIGKVDLEAAMRNESFPPEVRAAAYHLLQSGAWDKLQQDGQISKNGQNPWKNVYTPENQAHFKGLDQAETVRRDMVRQSQDLQRRAGGMWAEYQGAQNPNQLRDLLGKVDAELGNNVQWGGVRSVRDAPYDAVQHDTNLRYLRQQIVNQLGK